MNAGDAHVPAHVRSLPRTFWIAVPGSGVGGPACAGRQACGQKHDDGEEGQEARGRAGDGAIGPLALGLDAEMSSRFLEGGLDAPTPDEPGDDVLGRAVEVGAQEREARDVLDRCAGASGSYVTRIAQVANFAIDAFGADAMIQAH